MKIANAKYQLEIEFVENTTNVLVIENPTVMEEIVHELQQQSDGEEGNFVLSEKNKIFKMEKELMLIINPFSLDFNDKKIINKLYLELLQYGNELLNKKEEINQLSVKLLDEIIDKSQYNNISFDLEIEWKEFFKLYGLKIDESYETLLEKLIEYIKILSDLCGIHLVCFVNIKNYLQDKEVNELYEIAYYKKVDLLLIESSDTRNLDNEHTFIIDRDRCLIIK